MTTLNQNEWIILNGQSFTLTPLSTNGSVSLTYAWASDTLCGSDPYWTCAPSHTQIGVVQSNYGHNFAEGWFDKVNAHSVTDALSIGTDLYSHLYLRVTSGSVSVAPTMDLAPVPLPAAGVLLPMALVAMAFIRRKK